ncbi:MAG TPA: hypothetical protein VK539_39920 [Myxococcaceae bacterium]|nr:hypothetical protein [Myxococcaceae bacterium]
MIQHSHRGEPHEGAARSRAQQAWDLCQLVMGVGLFVIIVAILGLYFLGPHFFPEAEALHAKLRGADGRNSPGIFLIIVTLGTLALLFVQRERQGVRAVLGLVVGGVLVVGLAGNMLPQATLWGWVFAALPAVLVVHHGLYLGLIKPRVVSREMMESKESASLTQPRFRANFKEMVEAQDRYFNAGNIALRFGMPALAIFTIGAVIFHGLTPLTPWSLETLLLDTTSIPAKEWITYSTMEAARLGAAGSYVYVLLYLGQRGFRHDITSGAALWCAVTLTLGPLMAAAVSKIWVAGAGVAAGGDTGWTTQALYFGIGMSPRHVAQFVARTAQRIMSDQSRFVPPDRSVPLAMIRGITPQIEERLGEEGVQDVVGLAMADPLRLQRGTNFDKHQILGWIDMAILAHALPESWQDLEKKGLRGARDLTWYVTEATPEKEAGLAKLASEELDVVVLKNVAQRLAQDAQAQRILLLYQLVGESEPRDERQPPGAGELLFSVGQRLATGLQQLPVAVATSIAAPPVEEAPSAEQAPPAEQAEPKAAPASQPQG